MLALAQFKAQYPELRGDGSAASDAWLETMLARGAELIGPAFAQMGIEDQAHGYQTAHLIATSPFGVNAKLSKSGDSWYLKQLNMLKRQAAFALGRVC